MTTRREFLLAQLAVWVATPGISLAQGTPRKPFVGAIYSTSPETLFAEIEVFKRRMSDLGYSPDQSVRLELRFAQGDAARHTALAKELVSLKPDVIYAPTAAGAAAVAQETRSIPIVFAVVDDPVANGFVESLAKPGRNMTGVTSLSSELDGKRLEVLVEAVPRVKKVGVIVNPAYTSSKTALLGIERAAQRLSLELVVAHAASAEEYAAAVDRLVRSGVQAISVATSPTSFLHRKILISSISKAKLPAIYWANTFPEAGGLLSYSVNWPRNHSRAAEIVVKILRGANPAALPVQLPTEFEMVVNMKTARELGITVPQTVVVRADRVIE